MALSPPPCFLQALRLEKYRCFPFFSIDFHPRLTVLSALNGEGKTAILDAIAVALRPFLDVMEDRKSSKGFQRSDILQFFDSYEKSNLSAYVRVEANASLFGEAIAWARQLEARKGARTTSAEAAPLRDFAQQYGREVLQRYEERGGKVGSESPVLPLFAYYGTGRLWDTARLKPSKKQVRSLAPNARIQGYRDALAPSSQYKAFVDWFRRFSYEAKKEKPSEERSPHKPQQMLACVQEAIEKALAPSGVSRLVWDFVEDTLVAEHPTHGRLPVDWMSDGIRTMIGLVGDLAHRAALLNPHLASDAAQKSSGIVLIDEVDMHLHPSWQQEVIASLQSAFPQVQFIVTTHSPQVLSTVHAESIRVLHSGKGGEARRPDEQTRGVQSTHVLERVMGVPSIPKTEEAAMLHRYRAMIEKGLFRSGEAEHLRHELEQHFGAKHPNLLECDRLIRFKELRIRATEGKRE